jgi:hypothetical protein
MPYIVGGVLSVVVAVFARRVGLDRDKAFYPTVLIVVGSYYVLFAVMSGSGPVVARVLLVMAVFAATAVIGFKSSGWIVAAGLAGHGLFDAIHGYVLQNPGVPAWWPAFCGTYDVGAGVILGWLLLRSSASSPG